MTDKEGGLMFPKRQDKKKHLAHAKTSILQRDFDRRRCWLCMRICKDYSEHSPGSLHKHHVFGGHARRKVSEAEGFFVWLCPQHHGIIHQDVEMNRDLKRQAQKVYEETHTRREFMQLVGVSYLDGGKESDEQKI